MQTSYFKDCIDCKIRTVNCHSTCKSYLEDKKTHNEKKAKADEQKIVSTVSFKNYDF